MTTALTGTRQTPEHIARRVEARKKNGTYNFTQEHRENLSIAHMGKPSGAKGKHWTNSEEFCKKASERMQGEKHHQWKGNDVGYGALHRWVEANLGKPTLCAHCGTTQKRMYHWANVSGKYKRELADWVRLCVPCHSRFDKNI